MSDHWQGFVQENAPGIIFTGYYWLLNAQRLSAMMFKETGGQQEPVALLVYIEYPNAAESYGAIMS